MTDLEIRDVEIVVAAEDQDIDVEGILDSDTWTQEMADYYIELTDSN